MDTIGLMARDYLEWARIQVIEYSPRLLLAILLLAGGWLLAKLLRRLTIRLLRALHLDVAAERAGIEDFLVQGGIRYTAVTLVGNVLYWFVIFAATLGALNVLGLDAADDLLRRVLLYIPNVLVALLVLLFGSVLARFVRGAAFAYLNNIGIEGATFLSVLAQGAILVFVGLVALEQLKIGGEIVISAFQLAFGALCLAFGLAFGLGGRRWAAQVLERMWKP